jgi:hypothetical protein
MQTNNLTDPACKATEFLMQQGKQRRIDAKYSDKRTRICSFFQKFYIHECFVPPLDWFAMCTHSLAFHPS